MCTIVVTFNENSPVTVRNMALAVRHRGPDTFEARVIGSHGVAACRLSIFGNQEAAMIFQDPLTGLTVLLNGEIYNYSDLWRELEVEGHCPGSDIEAELIARLYSIHGKGFAAHLEGMFAIAILDGEKLVLARDRFGVKPLYYVQKGKTVLVCSEIKGLLKHPKITPALNTAALEDSAVFGYVHSQEETFFQGIRQVKPGVVLVFDSVGAVSEQTFGAFPLAFYLNNGFRQDYQGAVRETKRLMIRAVERMFRHGSMEKGIYLSGGLDSSTMAYIARMELGYPLKTFSLADSHDSPDLLAARTVAKALDTEHHEFIVSLGEYWRWLPDYVAHFESLMAGGVFHIQGGLAFHILSKHVSDHVRVAFSGEGADELFGGYYWIYTHPLGFSDRIRGHLSRFGKNERLEQIVDAIFPQPEDEKAYRRNLLDDLLRGGLSNYHLQSVDRSGGAFGFEIRPLYLDDDLSQWAMELPIEYKVPEKYVTKRILRDAFRDDFKKHHIEEVTTRLKLGMPAAVENLDIQVSKQVDRAITNDELHAHPLGHLLGSKKGLLLFDLYEHIFFRGWDHHSDTPPTGSLLSRVWPR
ncbi:MAG: asparagine synthase (glutamine-hydrolyzing) [Syntrophales bacterium]|nr:asparagine synthase (glutamine-hydrolyzing) [Syntrophales bacterium]